MLLTLCPQCSAQFKVAPEQLNIRQGRVMCGRCRHVFNAFESLKRIADEDVPIEVTDYAVIDSSLQTDDAPLLGEHTTDIAATYHIETPEPVNAPANEPATKPVNQHAAEFITVTTATAASDDALLMPAIEADAAPNDNPITSTLTSQNPLIRGSVPSPKQASRIWGYLVGVAVIGLAAQAIYFFRSDIAQQYPELRPHMLQACETLRCQIPWGRVTESIKIESSDLIEPPGKPGRILLLATVANRAATTHDFPHIEVKLMDSANTVLASRVFTPTEYLARTPNADEGMAANTELYVNLQLELVGKTTASGYGLRAFYP
jgi:predicted Zn finger-like uncharacterized protein